MESESSKPWERLEGEPASWYRRFAELYLAQTGARSLLGTFNAEQDRKGRKRSDDVPGNWRAIAERWQWKPRAEAYDLEQSRLTFQEWERRQAEQREREWDMATKLLEKAQQMLQFPLARVTKDDGDKRTIIEPADWRVADAAKMADTAAKLARLAAGMDTDKRTVNITWEDEVIELIRSRKVTYQDVQNEYDSELATELFIRAGVPIRQSEEAETQGGGEGT